MKKIIINADKINDIRHKLVNLQRILKGLELQLAKIQTELLEIVNYINNEKKNKD